MNMFFCLRVNRSWTGVGREGALFISLCKLASVSDERCWESLSCPVGACRVKGSIMGCLKKTEPIPELFKYCKGVLKIIVIISFI